MHNFIGYLVQYKLLKIALISLFTFIGVVAISKPVFAADFTKSVIKEVRVETSDSAIITETHTLTWGGSSTYFPASKNFAYFYIFPATINKNEDINTKVSDIKIVDGYGNSVNFEKTIEDGNISIKVPYYRNLSNTEPLKYTFSYKTTLLTKKEGKILEVIHNALSKDFQERRNNKQGGYDEIFKTSYIFKINKDLGEVGGILPSTGKLSEQGNYNVVTFTQADLVERAVRVTVGKQRIVRFELNVDVSKTNNSAHPLISSIVNNTIEIAIPHDYQINGQKVYFDNFFPEPTQLKTDTDGNVIALIPVNATKDNKITISGYAVIEKPAFSRDNLVKWKIGDIDENMRSNVLFPYFQGSSPYWPVTDSAIKEIAEKYKDPSGSILLTAENTMRFVTGTLEYANYSSEAELKRLGAKGALDMRRGVCMEYSDLLLTILRGQGIPARNIYGDGVGSLIDRSIEGIGHQWIEIWIPEVGWITLDPTWSENGYLIMGPDLDHFMWYKTSKSPDEPSSFSCLTWDNTASCANAMSINTFPAESVPSSAISFTDFQRKVETKSANISAESAAFTNFVNYFGNSYIGRILLNTVTLNILLAIFLYLVIYWAFRIGHKLIKGRKLK